MIPVFGGETAKRGCAEVVVLRKWIRGVFRLAWGAMRI